MADSGEDALLRLLRIQELRKPTPTELILSQWPQMERAYIKVPDKSEVDRIERYASQVVMELLYRTMMYMAEKDSEVEDEMAKKLRHDLVDQIRQLLVLGGWLRHTGRAEIGYGQPTEAKHGNPIGK